MVAEKTLSEVRVSDTPIPLAPLLSTAGQSIIEGTFSVGVFAYLVHGTGSVAAANLIGAFFWASMLVADIPTGYITDRLGPKRSLLISVLLRALAFGLYFLGGHSSVILAAAGFVAGIAVTFGTGTLMAQMKLIGEVYGKSIDGRRLSGFAAFFGGIGFVVGSVLGWLTIQYLGLSFIWIAAILCSLGLLVLISASWEQLASSTERHFALHLRAASRLLMGNRVLRNLFIADALTLLAALSVNSNFVAVFVPKLDSTPQLLLVATVGYWAIRLTASLLVNHPRAKRLISGPGVLFALGAAMFLSAVSVEPWRIVASAIVVGCICLSAIAFSSRIYEQLPTGEAATLLSIHSTLGNATGTFGLLVLGVALTHYSIVQTWAASALIALFVGAWAWRSGLLSHE